MHHLPSLFPDNLHHNTLCPSWLLLCKFLWSQGTARLGYWEYRCCVVATPHLSGYAMHSVPHHEGLYSDMPRLRLSYNDIHNAISATAPKIKEQFGEFGDTPGSRPCR